jgi:glucosyl-3-phosphoglycerate synthase
MDYTQERVATLHDFGGAEPAAPVDETTVVVPMTEREFTALAAEGVLEAVADAGAARTLVPLRASAERAPEIVAWLDSLDADPDVFWCHGPRVERRLRETGVNGSRGKGRDIWLALGQIETPYVALQDADAAGFEAGDLRRLCHPLGEGYEFSKAYYARVENGRLYGRLCRLFYEPLLSALADAYDDDLVDYLGAFRYALSGEVAMTRGLARSLRPQRTWGLEVGTLADAFRTAGFAGSAQVDSGTYVHDHRAVTGPASLTDMSEGVGAAVFRALAERGVEPEYDDLRERYRERARELVRSYAADARFNGLDYDAGAEREQVESYAPAVAPPGADDRLPPWTDDPIDTAALREDAREDLAEARGE